MGGEPAGGGEGGGDGVAGICGKGRRGGGNGGKAKNQKPRGQSELYADVANQCITVQPVTEQTSNKGREGY